MANEFVVRNGIIVSGSTYLESISQSLQTSVLGYNAATNEVFYQSTASLVPSTASFAITASFALNVPATASTAVSASFAQSASNARSAVTASSADTFYVRGSVGIGITNPSEALNIGSNGQLRFDGNVSGKGIVASSNGSNQTFSITRQDGVNTGDLSISGYSGIGLTGNRLDSPATSSYHLYINSSGNVGISTTSPGYKLDINGITNIASSTVALRIGGTVALGRGLSTDGTRLNGGTTDGIEFTANNDSSITTVFRPNGNVGIGTTNPGYKLDVSGTARVTSTLIGGGRISAATEYRLNDNSYSRVAILDGAGAFAGGYNFNINSGTAQHDSTGAVAAYYYNSAGYISLFTNSSQAAGTAASERLRITATGNVGIGTTNPGSKLTVIGDIVTSTRVASDTINGYTGGSTPLTIQTGGSQNVIFGTNNTERMRISTAGDVQIGTTAYATVGGSGYLMVKNVIGLVPDNIANTNNRNWAIQANGQFNGSLDFVTSAASASFPNDAYRVSFTRTGGVVASSFTGSFSGTATNAVSASFAATASSADAFYVRGSVGIGTTSPLSKLQVRTSTNQNFRISAGTNLEVASINDADSAYTPLTFRASTFDFQNGSVGIGTTSPGSRLTVAGEGSGSVRMGNTGFGGDWVGISLSGNLNTTDYNLLSSATNTSFYLNRPSGGDMLFRHNNVDQMIIKSGGNVGIGTTNPIYKLHVVGSTYVNSGTLFVDSGEYIRWGNSAQGIRGVNDTSLEFVAGSSTRMYVSSSGNVGIGTTNPLSPLHIGAYTPAGGYARGTVATLAGLWNSGLPTIMAIATDTTSTQDKGGSIGFGVGSEAGSTPYIYAQIKGLKELTGGTYNGYMAFYTTPAGSDANTERMRINSVGNVGIGTTNPAATLDLYQSANTTAIRMTSAGVGSKIYRLTSQLIGTSNAGFGILNDTDSRYELAINADGNVGIGTTSPGQKLEVNGNIIATPGNKIGFRYDSNDANLYGYITRAGGGGVYPLTIVGGLETGTTSVEAIRFETLTPGNARMSILNNGNVGIGITNPTSRLHVSGGNGYIDGDLTVTGAITAQELYVQYISSSIIYSTGSNKFGDQTSDNQFFTGSLLLSGSFSAVSNTSYFSGNVGIGTVSPTEKLELSGTGNVYARVTATDASNAGVRFNAVGAREYGIFSDGDLRFYDFTAASERMRINSGGNVGIGTTSPITTLDIRTDTGVLIKGKTSTTDAKLSFLPTTGGRQYDFGNDGSSFRIKDASADITRMYFHNDGNTGVGTTSPQGKLHVVHPGGLYNAVITSQASLTGSVVISADSNGGTSRASLILRGSDSIGGGLSVAREDTAATWRTYMAFYTNNLTGGNVLDIQEKMRLNSDGNLGIGTTAPATKLQVVGSVALNTATDGTSRYYTYPDANHTWYYDSDIVGSSADVMTYYENFLIRHQDTTNVFLINGAGNVGIGTTSPVSPLQVNGIAQFGDLGSMTFSGAPVNIRTTETGSIAMTHTAVRTYTLGVNSSGTFNIRDFDAPADRLSITSGGNVGIGITNPDAKLDVLGTSDTADIVRVRKSSTGSRRGALGTESGIGYLDLYNDSSVLSIRLLANGSSYLSGGSVGIGTTNPANKFVVTVDLDGSQRVALFRNTNSTGYTSIAVDRPNTARYSFVEHTTAGTTDWYVGTGYAGGGGNSSYQIGTGINTTDAKLLITTGGNVGIGTTSPANLLHLRGGAGGGDAANLRIDSTNDFGGLVINENTTFRTFLGYGNSGNIFSNAQTDSTALRGANYLHLGASSAATITIDSNDRVGIGTTNPAGKLHVLTPSADGFPGLIVSSSGWGAIGTPMAVFDGGPIGDGDVFKVKGLGGRSDAKLFQVEGASGTTAMVVKGNGNVGIGTVNPAYRLQVNGGTAGSSGIIANFTNGANADRLSIIDEGTGMGQGSGLYNPTGFGLRLWAASGPITLTTGGSSDIIMTVTGSRVGIGSASPSNILDIQTNQVGGYNGISINSTGSNANQAGLRLAAGNGSTNRASRIDFVNNVASATVPRWTLINDYNQNGTNDFRFILSDTSTSALTLLQSGNVGIGTTNPAYKLGVVTSGTLGFNIVTANSTVGGPAMDIYDTGRAQETVISSTDGTTVGTYIASYTNHPLLFNTNAGSSPTAKMILTTGGSVGIGSASPAAKLDIVGSNSGLALSFGTTVPNNPLFINTYGGWSGIGMDSATAGVRIAGEYQTNNPVVDMGYYTSATVQHANWTSVMMVRQGGNVGIGTTSPAVKLDIFGLTNTSIFNLRQSAGLLTQIESDNGYANLFLYQAGSNPRIGLVSNGSSFFNGGNVGIGTTNPGYQLDVAPGVASATIKAGSWAVLQNVTTNQAMFSRNTAFDTSAGTGWRTINTGGATAIRMYDDPGDPSIGFHLHASETAGTSLGAWDSTDVKMTLRVSGNLGIGTTSPTQRLSVYGDIALANTTSIQETRIGKYQSGSLGSGTHTIASISATNVDAVFFDYVIKNSTTDLRAGTVMAVTNGSTVEYTDISTSDIGDTSRITMISDVSGGNIRLRASIDTGAGSWTIRTLLRTL